MSELCDLSELPLSVPGTSLSWMSLKKLIYPFNLHNLIKSVYG